MNQSDLIADTCDEIKTLLLKKTMIMETAFPSSIKNMGY